MQVSFLVKAVIFWLNFALLALPAGNIMRVATEGTTKAGAASTTLFRLAHACRGRRPGDRILQVI
jgi:hypothetical protein